MKPGQVQGDWGTSFLGGLGLTAFPEAGTASHFCFLDQQEHGALLPPVDEPSRTDQVNVMRSVGLGLGYLSPLRWPVERIPQSFPWKLGSRNRFFSPSESVVVGGKVDVVRRESVLCSWRRRHLVLLKAMARQQLFRFGFFQRQSLKRES